MANLNKVSSQVELAGVSSVEIEAFLEALANGASDAGRQPVKTRFTPSELRLLGDHFESTKSGKRGQPFVGICGLLGRTLTAANCAPLFETNLVRDLHFLVGRDRLRLDRSNTDWTNKYCGLGRARGGFVVGLTPLFYQYALVGDLLPKDESDL